MPTRDYLQALFKQSGLAVTTFLSNITQIQKNNGLLGTYIEVKNRI